MTSQHSYETRNNYRRVMDHLEKNQHIVREDMDLMKGKVQQLLEAIQAMSRMEEELDQVALINAIPSVASASIPPLVVTKLAYRLPSGYTHLLEGNTIPQHV